MSSEGTIVMMGLPGSGKSTFLAALWHQLEAAEIPTVFVAEQLQPDREYLNKIREKWLEFEEIPRTPIGIERSALLHLRHVRTEAKFDLSIPDVAGEMFASQWYARLIPQGYVRQLETSFGLLLFVHCRQVAQAQRLSAGTSGLAVSPTQAVEWEPRLSPTQVQLVDLLQFALSTFARRRGMRIAILISAWDEIKERTTPAAWLEQKLPLLDQFLRANTEELSFQIFGVSAIGGNLSDKEALASTSSPSSRVRLHVTSEALRDLTLPLEFLTVGERES